MNPMLGVFLHAVGGFAAGSFYIPFRGVRKWAWESGWMVNGLFAWVIVPWVVAGLTVPHLLPVLKQSPSSSLFWSYFFGVLWGVGSFTFGLTMRYLGMSLGYALALGNTAAFGTIIPPIYFGTFGGLLAKTSGLITVGGVLICLLGISIVGLAGMAREKESSELEKRTAIREFNFRKGFWIAILCGVMSACFAFGIAAGKPIAHQALLNGTPSIWQNGPVFIVILAGGLTTSLIWCVFLGIKNRSLGDYVNREAPLPANYFFSALAGITWYFQFMFYGMGTTRMGKYDFSSWSIHMAFIIVFSNLWGLYFREWKGASRRTYGLIVFAILVLVLSTAIIGVGNYLASLGR